jgi:hypothetical protein
MSEWLTLPPHVSFRTLQAGARDARRAFEEFTLEYDAEKADKERASVAEASGSEDRSKAESTATDQVNNLSLSSQLSRGAHLNDLQVKVPVFNPHHG